MRTRLVDQERFDQLTISPANGASRRSFLKGLLGLGGTAVITTVASGEADARRRGGQASTPTTPEPATTKRVRALPFRSRKPAQISAAEPPIVAAD